MINKPFVRADWLTLKTSALESLYNGEVTLNLFLEQFHLIACTVLHIQATVHNKEFILEAGF